MSFVVDAGVAVQWFLPEPHDGRAAARLLADDLALYAPQLITSDITSLLEQRLHRGGTNPHQAAAILMALPVMLTRMVPDNDLAGRALQWSQELRHPAHNCFYLACADETGCHLVSSDPHLRQAGRVAGLTVLSLPEAVARLPA